MFEHLLTVSGEVLGIKDRQFNIVFSEEVEQSLLPRDLRQLARITISPKKIKGVIDQPALPACSQFSLQFGLMNPGISIRFGTRETHKRPTAPWGQWRAFYLLPEKLEQSGDVTALTTTNGLQSFPDQDSGLTKHRDSTESPILQDAINLHRPAWCFHPEQIWAGEGPLQCGPFAVW